MALHGRTKIYTDEITDENIIDEVTKALTKHAKNVREEDYLFWYRRGRQPILYREKLVRPEINTKIVENHAQEIVTFKDGYFLSQPAYYKSRRDNARINKQVDALNELLYLSGKHEADNKVVDNFHTMGLGVIYIDTDKDHPLKAYSLDPRRAFCGYSRMPGEEPTMGVNTVWTGEERLIDVFTKTRIYHLSSNSNTFSTPLTLISAERNPFGEIPIIEYQYENNRMGAFEPVIDLLDALNEMQSDAANGVKQFIQSLMIFYNCELGEDDKGDKITPAYIREAGAVFLKSIGQDRADLKILSEQLDQTQTQVLKDNLYQQILHIVGMPQSGTNSNGTSDNVGAVIWRSGWYQADTYARNTEDLFKESNRRFDKVMLSILKTKRLTKLELADFELQFTRNETDTLFTRTQAALNMRELGFSPEIAFARSGVSNDPVADVMNSKKYIDLKWGQNADGNGNSYNQPGTAPRQNGRGEDRERASDHRGTWTAEDNI